MKEELRRMWKAAIVSILVTTSRPNFLEKYRKTRNTLAEKRNALNWRRLKTK
jgi:hypothetical protein